MNTVYIYTLTDPNTNQVRYVGKTINLTARLAKHKRDALTEGSTSARRNAWLRSLYTNNQAPILSVVEEVTEDIWDERERYHIAQFLHGGCNLTNMTSGGEGCTFRGENHWNHGRHLSEDTKAKISAKAKQRWTSGRYEFHRQPNSVRWTPEQAEQQRQMMCQYNATKVVSEATRKRLSEHQSRAIVLVDFEGKICYNFANARVASENLGCKRSNINNRRRDGGLVKHKYRVYYEDEYNTAPVNQGPIS